MTRDHNSEQSRIVQNKKIRYFSTDEDVVFVIFHKNFLLRCGL